MKEFIKGIFESDQPQSSKRVFGAIGFLTAIIFIAIWQHDLIQTLLLVSCGLLGLETFASMFKSKTELKQTDTTSQTFTAENIAPTVGQFVNYNWPQLHFDTPYHFTDLKMGAYCTYTVGGNFYGESNIMDITITQ